jgi:hypothetical protein
VGVTGYQIFRNGTQIGTSSTTIYADNTVQGGVAYNYYVVAVDAAGFTSNPSNTINLTTPLVTPTITPTSSRTPTISPTQTSTQPGTLTFTPIADSYVRVDQPASNFGSSAQIIADNSPVNNLLLKFTVSGVGNQSVVSARLRLYCVNGSANGGEFHRVTDTNWSEGTVNWNNAPPADAGILGTLGRVSAGAWYEVNVTSLVTGDGTYSLRASSTSTDGAYYSSKEGAVGFAPQLVVLTGGSTPVSTQAVTLTNTPSRTPTPTASTAPLVSLTPTNTPSYTSTSAEITTPSVTPTPTITSTPTITRTPTIPPSLTSTQPGTLIFVPSADTYVQSDQPTINFGANSQMVADNSPVRNMLLKFDVSGIGTQTIVSAKLRLYCVNGSLFGGEFHKVSDTSWDESAVTWNNAPAADAGSLASLGSVLSGRWYEVDVTSLITGDGTFSLSVNSTSNDGAYYSSREGAADLRPQLIILANP